MRAEDRERVEDAIELAFKFGGEEAQVRAVVEEAVTRYAAYYVPSPQAWLRGGGSGHRVDRRGR